MSNTADREYLLKLRRFKKLAREFALFFYEPYEKQKEFHAIGALKRERLLMAGNRLGKTMSMADETAMHATGLYPDWWQGKRFGKETRGWVGSVTSELTRDGAQRMLLGPPTALGTGAIPKDRIVSLKRSRGINDAYDSVHVKHINGEISQISFKSYKEGREAWQADELDYVWFDEEPPMDIYTEGLTRTNNTGGFVALTFTPLMGMTEVVMRFLNESSPDRGVVQMTIDDVGHYTDEDRRKIISAYLPHEREARSKGVPMMGSGRVYPIPEETIKEPQQQIPDHWAQIIGIDFGWDHPTAAVRIVWDRQNDVVHIVSTYRQREQTPVVHSAAIRAWGKWIPVAWPHDGYQRDKGSGVQMAELYRKQEVRMIHEHAQYPDGRGKSVEAGVMEIMDRMLTGRLKVDENLSEWWEEFRMYHRVKGEIIKLQDDLMDATRYAVMMLRHAQVNIELEKPRDRYGLKRHTGQTWMSA